MGAREDAEATGERAAADAAPEERGTARDSSTAAMGDGGPGGANGEAKRRHCEGHEEEEEEEAESGEIIFLGREGCV